MSTVILCNKNGYPVRSAGTDEAHNSPGKLHRAFSAFIFRKGKNELLIQKRSKDKRLFANLWTNTCCSHPQKDESTNDAAQRRLKEELGFTCSLKEVGSFTYRAEDPHGNGVEHEYDTVLVGNVESAIHVVANPKEIDDWKWVPIPQLQKDLQNNPDKYTPWFAQALGVALQ